MAATYESIQTASATNANAVTVTKPASVVLSDILIAMITNGGRNDPATAATLSGWTQITNTNSAANAHNLDTTVLARVATAADVSASNYTFSVTNTTDVVLGAIIRVSGGFSSVAASEVADADTGGHGGANTYTGGVTPNESGTLLIIGEATAAGNNNTHDSYAVTNDNPSWTERADFGTNYNDGATNDFLHIGIATATYSVGTATGNYRVTNSNTAVNNAHGFLISINPSPQSVSVTGDTGIISFVTNEGTVAGGANITGTTGLLNLVGNEGTTTLSDNKWSNTDKSSVPSWVNKDKS